MNIAKSSENHKIHKFRCLLPIVKKKNIYLLFSLFGICKQNFRDQ